VDDDVVQCSFIEFLLSSTNEEYTVVSANSAEKAVELIEKETFDLYILDNWMMGISGVELCSIIRSSNKQTPILFFSGASQQKYRDEAMISGASEYLVKPNDLGRIEETVSRLLKQYSPKSDKPANFM
jgi:CitB family two-component system response regulator MalR